MYSNNRQLAYAPTPYVPRSTLSATINLDEVIMRRLRHGNCPC